MSGGEIAVVEIVGLTKLVLIGKVDIQIPNGLENLHVDQIMTPS